MARRRPGARAYSRRFRQPVQEHGQRVVANDLAVGRDVAVADAVAVPPANLVGVEAEVGGDLLDDVLDGGDGLRSAEAAKGGVGRQVGPAHRPGELDVGDVVGVLGVEQRALHDGQRQVGREAAVGEEVDFQAGDEALAREADAVARLVGMAFAGDLHVLVAGEDAARRAAGSCEATSAARSGGVGALRLLAAEAAAHAPADADHLVLAQTQAAGRPRPGSRSDSAWTSGW